MKKVLGTALLLAAAGTATGVGAMDASGNWPCVDTRDCSGSIAGSSGTRQVGPAVRPDGKVEGAGAAEMVNGACFEYCFSGQWIVAVSTLGGTQMTFENCFIGPDDMARRWVDRATGAELATHCKRGV